MNNKTKKQIRVLKESIIHWEDNVAITELSEVKLGPDNCACCNEWFSSYEGINDRSKSCTGCPISEYTGRSHCIETPYSEYYFDDLYQYLFNNYEEDKALLKPFNVYIEQFQEEVDFLKEVLKWLEDGKPEK